MAEPSVGPWSLLFAVLRVGVGGSVEGLSDSLEGLRLTIRRRKQSCSAEARSARPIIPPCSLCQNTQAYPASSHVLKTYSGLVFTVLRGDVTLTAEHTALEEPPGLHRGSVGPRPQARETLSSGLRLRESCQGMFLSFRS